MLKILIAEDDMISRKLLWKILEPYGECDLVINGVEAIDAFMLAHRMKVPYDMVCLDIMMPKVDGIKVLKTIRNLELQEEIENPVKVIMITALAETAVVEESFNKGADAYANKPLNIEKMIDVMRNLELIE